jgi:hypothetical protein
MSTTYLQAQDRVMDLIRLGAWSNSFTPPDPSYLVNYGAGEFIRNTNYNQESALIQTVAGQLVYGLTSDLPDFPPGFPLGPRKWYSINDDALWQIVPGAPGSASYLPQTTRQKLRMTDIQYLDCPASIPLCWYIANDQEIGLYPPPSQSGIYVQFSGNRDIPDLVEPDDTFPWHDRYTEACCLFGAYQFGKTIARGEELQTLGRYLKEAMDLCAEFSQDFTDKEAALINRNIQQPSQDYLLTGNIVVPNYQSPTQFFPGLT